MKTKQYCYFRGKHEANSSKQLPQKKMNVHMIANLSTLLISSYQRRRRRRRRRRRVAQVPQYLRLLQTGLLLLPHLIVLLLLAYHGEASFDTSAVRRKQRGECYMNCNMLFHITYKNR